MVTTQAFLSPTVMEIFCPIQTELQIFWMTVCSDLFWKIYFGNHTGNIISQTKNVKIPTAGGRSYILWVDFDQLSVWWPLKWRLFLQILMQTMHFLYSTSTILLQLFHHSTQETLFLQAILETAGQPIRWPSSTLKIKRNPKLWKWL